MSSLLRLLRALFASFALVAALAAAPSEVSLAPNLNYTRVRLLPGDLPTSNDRGSALVLDLRFVTADEPAAASFAAWLKQSRSARAALIVLINADTSPALRATLQRSSTGIVTIAPADSRVAADLAVTTSSEADRRAYEALENGTSLQQLIAPKVAKARRDESTFARERNGNPPSVDASDSESDKQDKADVTPQVVDAVLQRAVHVHRAWIALRKN